MNNFETWNNLKQQTHSQNHKPPFVNVGDIWWTHIGHNIGYEINGKGKRFVRPVIVLHKLNAYIFLCVPLTSANKSGSWYVSFSFQDKISVACLHQIRVIDYRRFADKFGEADEQDLKKTQKGFYSLYNFM